MLTVSEHLPASPKTSVRKANLELQLPDRVYVLPLPNDLPELRHRIEVAIVSITPDLLNEVTPITDKDNILNDITKTWDESPDEIKELYPEGYIERYKRATLKFLSLSISDKPQEVVNCMEEAVVSYDPKYVYNPGTYFSRLSHWLLCRLPKPVADLLVHDQCVVKFPQ